MEGGDECSRAHSWVSVDDGLLHVSLDGLQHHGVSDGAKGTDGCRPVVVLLASHVLGERGGDDDDILGNIGQLLNTKVHQPA